MTLIGRFYEADANRYLLRHETFNAEHYESLHRRTKRTKTSTVPLGFKRDRLPGGNRIHGRLTRTDSRTSGRGYAIYSKAESTDGRIGPFIPHHDTPFAKKNAGTLELTLFMLGLLRLTIPNVLLPQRPPLERSTRRTRTGHPLPEPT